MMTINTMMPLSLFNKSGNHFFELENFRNKYSNLERKRPVLQGE